MVKHTSTIKPAKKSKSPVKEQEDRSEPEIHSSTTKNITKNIKKATRPTQSASKTKKLIIQSRKKGSEDGGTHLCEEHGSAIEFICKMCYEDLCGHCILCHKEHIDSIVGVKEIMKKFIDNGDEFIPNPDKLLKDVHRIKKQSLSDMDEMQQKLHDMINQFFSKLKSKINNDFLSTTTTVDNLAEFKEKSIEIMNGNDDLTNDDIQLVKTYLKYSEKIQNNKPIMQELIINEEELIDEINNGLQQNFTFENFDTTVPGIPKCLHWFEWGKKRLNLYNIVTNTTQVIELNIHFKIPSFSRSIMLPSGLVFVLGGEEPEYISRKEMYMYDLLGNDKKLRQKAPMLSKKFDFTLAHLNGFIYVICGKDSSSEIVDTCERYSVEDNQWQQIQPVKNKRYAASAVGMPNNRIYLFGGRSDQNNQMVQDIEEYCAVKNEWNTLEIRNINIWDPVEVCGCIQIREDEIFIFGGSDAQIKDSTSSFVFNIKDKGFEKKGDLKKPQVFVNSPFLYKNHVYALGNEYYMKNRNLHRYSIESGEWSIVFQSEQ